MRGCYNESVDALDSFLGETLTAQGTTSAQIADVTPHLQRMLEEEFSNALPISHVPRVLKPLHDYSDIFRTKLGSERPEKEPEKLELVQKKPQSAWDCAFHIFPKPGPQNLRFKTDLRPVSMITIPHAWKMADLESIMGRLQLLAFPKATGS